MAGRTMKKQGKRSATPLLKDGKTPASEAALEKALARYNVEVAPEDGVAEKLAKVRGWLEARFAELAHTCVESCSNLETSQCPKVLCDCEEVATLETDFCPFCGSNGLPAQPAEVSQPTPIAESEEEPPPQQGTPETEESGVEVYEEREEVSADSAELTPSEEGNLAMVQDLDASVHRIQHLKQNIAENSYDLGVELGRVIHLELWKARGYKNFAKWVEGEVGISKSTAYALVDMIENFERDTYLKVGSTKLRLIANIEDPEKRKEVLAEAVQGKASVRDIQRVVKGDPSPTPPPPNVEESAAEESAPHPPVPTPPAERPTPPKKNTKEITLLAKVDGRPKRHPFISSKTGQKVKHFRQDEGDYVELALSENVSLQVAPVLDGDGKITHLTIAFIEVM